MNRCKEWNRLTQEQKDIILKHQESFPIKLGALAKDFGLIVKSSTLRPGISGFIKDNGGEVIIKISRHDSKERQRFTLAHEIAHFLLHKEEIKGGIEDTMLYRSNVSSELEVEANKLAADIVMPFSLIHKVKFSSEITFEEKVEKVASLAQLSTAAVKIRIGRKEFW
ncbi:ImmA/IrrE family metallo-endopeptidase [Halobacteriovorax sp. HFRX-2_2]|uniref:ImmA/IrrE family metallo-endopeptidase n=1 Tax=unclassified Halobacteriovorax TaxID=2639665 RepID=UPI00371CD3E8